MSKFARLFSKVASNGKFLVASSAAAGLGLATTLDSDEHNENETGASYGFKPQVGPKPHFIDSQHQQLPEAKIIRKIPHLLNDNNKLDLRIYQFQACPFCCKVRAFLDYYGFGYEVVEVNSVTKREIKFSEYKKVPIIVAKGWENKQLNDSSFIISFLKSYFVDPEKPLDDIKDCYPIFVIRDDSKKKKDNVTFENDNKYFVMYDEKLKTKMDISQRREEREWREWVDTKFVHVISPNVYRTLGESLSTFRWFATSGNWSSVFAGYETLFIVYAGSAIMYLVGKSLKKKYNLKPDVRESLYDLCNEWTNAIGPSRKFMGGDRPNLADLAVYGTLSSFEGCQAFMDMEQNTKIGQWYADTKEAVKNRLGANEFRLE